MSLEKDSFLNQRYRIIDILGQGGMGAVYRAMDENLGVVVAVKENLFLTDEYARQFRREATILAGLRHPNLPRVSDHFVIDDQGQYLVMDFIEGEDLRERMERTGTLTEKEVIQVGVAICDALSYLHTRTPPILHRDIKPGNVKITPEGEIFLVDFGLAKVMEGSQATTTGARAMTPGYSPPEQYGTARTDPRTDIYSLGATLYAALSGVIPEDGLARATGNAALTPLRKVNPKIGNRLAKAIERSLALRVDDRFQIADDFKEALLQAYDDNSQPLPAANWPVTLDPNNTVKNNTPPPILETGQLPATSAPISVPLPRPKKRPVRRGALLLYSFGIIILAGIIGGYAMLYPGWRAALARIIVTETPTAVASPLPTTTQMKTAPSAGATDTPAAVVLPSTDTPTTPATQAVKTLPAAITPETANTSLPDGNGVIALATTYQSGIPQIWTTTLDNKNLFQVTHQTGGACQPDWSPDGKQLVFISPCQERQNAYPGAALHIVNADGSNLRELPWAPEGDYEPVWSPDGQQIAFTSLRDGLAQIYVINLATNKAVRLSNFGGTDQNPAWSRDGKMLAFSRTKPANSNQIWTMNADGTNQLQLTRSGAMFDYWPEWNPTGDIIFFSQRKEDAFFPWLAGKRLADRMLPKEFILPANPDPNSGPITRISLSPDGHWMVFESWTEGNNHDIYRMNILGTDLKKVIDLSTLDFNPAWRPESTTP